MRALQEARKKQKRKEARDALARGEVPIDSDEEEGGYRPYGKDDVGMQGGIIIPRIPIGIPKYDNGERFDLRVRASLAPRSLQRATEAVFMRAASGSSVICMLCLLIPQIICCHTPHLCIQSM